MSSASRALHARDQNSCDPLPPDLVAQAIARYDLPCGAAATFLRHGENTTYCVTVAGRPRYVLRVHRPGYQTLDAIRSELAWMEALRASGVPTPISLPGIDGEPIQTVTAAGGASTRSVALFEWIDGVPLSAVAAVEPWTRLGELMGRIHEHGCAWQRPPWFTRPAWDAEALVGEEPRWGPVDPRGVFAPDDRAALEACRAEVASRLAALGTRRDRFGLIHGDLGFENALVTDDGSVVTIDFDDCGASWFVHEFAVALYPYDRTSGLSERGEALVQGYRRVRELPEELVGELPTFLMARRLATLGWVFSRSETAHARRQRPRRLESTPAAAREFLAWASARPL
jgi:Ser/Thr protein kinase RdoA (MazF antagonist)